VLLVLGELPLGGRGGKVRLPKEAKLLSVKLREVLEGRSRPPSCSAAALVFELRLREFLGLEEGLRMLGAGEDE